MNPSRTKLTTNASGSGVADLIRNDVPLEVKKLHFYPILRSSAQTQVEFIDTVKSKSQSFRLGNVIIYAKRI